MAQCSSSSLWGSARTVRRPRRLFERL